MRGSSIAGAASRLALAIAVLGLASCGTKRTVTSSEGAPARGIDRYEWSNADIEYGEKGSKEEGIIVGGKRSQFEGRQQSIFGGSVEGGTYRKKPYATTGWDGGKKARTKSYEGTEDGRKFQLSSIFGKKKATEGGDRSRFDGQSLARSRFATGAARETGAASIAKPSDAETNVRRRVYPEPVKRSLREHQEMTIQQTNSLLGRD